MADRPRGPDGPAGTGVAAKECSIPPGSSETELRLIESALKLSIRKRHDSISVAEICREADLSNGVFYRYFSGKDELERRLLDDAMGRIGRAIYAAADNPHPERRLGLLAESLAGCGGIDPALLAVFHEGRYRFADCRRRIHELFQEGLSRALERKAIFPEDVFSIGSPYFCAVRRALQSVPVVESTVSAIVLRGAFPDLDFEEERVFAPPEAPPPPDGISRLSEALSSAGETLFSKKGFTATNVHDIASAAGCSVGAFYLYFPSKDSFHGQLVQRLYADLERFVSANLPEGLNRLERELRRLWLFALRVRADRNRRRLLQEAEFVSPRATDAFRESMVSSVWNSLLAEPGFDPSLDTRTTTEFLLGLAQAVGLDPEISPSDDTLRYEIASLGRLLAGGIGRPLKDAV